MIVLTGATGKLGRLVAERLIDKMPAEEIGISVRDPEKARALAERGVRVRQGDYQNPASLRHAFEGATQVFLVSSNASATGGDPLAQHRAAIEAAKAVGARRVVYTSQIASSDASAFPPARDHAATEAMLGQSGLAWTALRHGFYAESALMLMGNAPKTGGIDAPVDGKVSWTTHEDLAEADAAILVDEGRFEGPTPPLTGSEALDLGDLAALVSTITSRPVLRRTLTDDELRAKMASRGVPDAGTKIALGLYLASRNGEFAAVDPTLELLLGRPPTPVLDFLASRLSH